MIPHNAIDMLDQCWNSITDLCRQLSDTDWKIATDLPGWSVQDNLSHLIGIERMMEGLPATTHRIAPPDFVRNAIGEMNENEVDARRSMSGAELLNEWIDLIALRTHTLHAADGDYFQQPAMTPTGPGTLADFLNVRILDCWLHEQDIRRAVGRPGHMSGAPAEHTVDRLIRTLPIVIGKRAATPEGGAVAINITGGVERHVFCEVRGGRAAIVSVPSSAPLSTVDLSTEAFVMLAAGRRTASHVSASTAGDLDLGQSVLSQLNMMI